MNTTDAVADEYAGDIPAGAAPDMIGLYIVVGLNLATTLIALVAKYVKKSKCCGSEVEFRSSASVNAMPSP